MTKPLHAMSPAERARYDAYQASRRTTDRPPLAFHTPDDRMAMAYMGWLINTARGKPRPGWSKASVGRAFDTDRQSVQRAMVTYPRST